MQKKGVKMLSELGNHRGQLTIFIVAGIILVSTVLVYFSIKSGFVPNLIGGGSKASVNAFLNNCLEEKIKDTKDAVLKNGGYNSNSFSTSFRFKDDSEPKNISYLCYTQNNYVPCKVQEAGLFYRIKNEIKTAISEDVESCFDDMISSFESQGNDVSSEYNGFDVSLEPGRVVIQTDSRVTITGSGETTTQENFKVITFTKLYELANVVQEIINKETSTCDFDHKRYQVQYPEINIDKIQVQSDSSDIYIIKHEDGGEEFMFAIRGCVIPPGL